MMQKMLAEVPNIEHSEEMKEFKEEIDKVLSEQLPSKIAEIYKDPALRSYLVSGRHLDLSEVKDITRETLPTAILMTDKYSTSVAVYGLRFTPMYSVQNLPVIVRVTKGSGVYKAMLKVIAKVREINSGLASIGEVVRACQTDDDLVELLPPKLHRFIPVRKPVKKTEIPNTPKPRITKDDIASKWLQITNQPAPLPGNPM